MTISCWASGLLSTIVFITMSQSSAETKPTRSLECFQSGGKEIRVETFGASARRSTPSVIVLHGATGVEFANRFIANLAESIATQGFVVHLVHYFDRTGSRYADESTIKRYSSDWLQTVHESAAFVRKRRPGAAIGFFGYSLGGYLAAAETVHNKDIDAAVILAGGLDENSARTAQHGAPVLILHGGADTRVPVNEARRLEAVLKRLGRAPKMHVYPHEGHIMSLAAYADIVQRSIEFLQTNLASSSP
jgi:dienelactone hydrolase